MAIGSFLALAGVAVLLGASVINEIIDGFAMTKTARDYRQEHQRASERWSEVTTAAAEAAIKLDVASTRARHEADPLPHRRLTEP